jgi:hypothetical protein
MTDQADVLTAEMLQVILGSANGRRRHYDVNAMRKRTVPRRLIKGSSPVIQLELEGADFYVRDTKPVPEDIPAL